MITYFSRPFSVSLNEQKSSATQGIISGYASIFGELDTQGDRVAVGAFTKSLQAFQRNKRWPKMLWQHDPDHPIGQWTSLKEDERGLYVEGALLLEVQKGREAYTFLKQNIIDGLSIGYRVVEAQKNRETQERILVEVDLVEVSLVTFAASEQAKILSVKKDAETSQHLVERINALTSYVEQSRTF